MDDKNISGSTETELQRQAAERFGAERAKALATDIRQMAGELDALNRYPVGFEDEP